MKDICFGTNFIKLEYYFLQLNLPKGTVNSLKIRTRRFVLYLISSIEKKTGQDENSKEVESYIKLVREINFHTVVLVFANESQERISKIICRF